MSVCALGFLLVPQDALAGQSIKNTATVAVVGLHVEGSDAEAEQAIGLLIKEMQKVKGLSPVSPTAVRLQLMGRESIVLEDAFLSPGRALADEGEVLMDRADFESAIEVLENAVQALEDGMAGATDIKDLVDTLLLLGLAQASVGEVDAARAAYKRVVVLDPTRSLDTIRYSPKIVTLFDQVREQVLMLPPAQLVVRAPEKAQVLVDGRDMGESPARANGLPAGLHYVHIVGQSGQRDFAGVTLDPNDSEVYTGTFEGRVIAQPAATRIAMATQVERIYRALGEHLQVDLVLLGGEIGNDRVGMQLYEPRTGLFSKGVATKVDGDPAMALVDLLPSLSKYITETGALQADRVSRKVVPLDISTNHILADALLEPKSTDVPVAGTEGGRVAWWVWAGAGAVALAGGGTAAILMNKTEDPGDEPPVAVQGTIVVGPIP